MKNYLLPFVIVTSDGLIHRMLLSPDANILQLVPICFSALGYHYTAAELVSINGKRLNDFDRFVNWSEAKG